MKRNKLRGYEIQTDEKLFWYLEYLEDYYTGFLKKIISFKEDLTKEVQS